MFLFFGNSRFATVPSWNPPKNFVLIRPSGIGKTHLATGLCYNAIQNGIPTAFITCSDLIEKLKRSSSKYTLLQYYSTVKLLCIDELGYVFPTQEQANDPFQIISKDGRELKMSRYTRPEKQQQLLLAQLKLTLPEQPPPEISTPAESYSEDLSGTLVHFKGLTAI